MPSSYSPDLRIELIANGEQSGTWGTTTNNNLGTLIEDAISGLASVAVTSADQALTALNGSADQARCAAIDLSIGAWGSPANFNIYVPPVPKLYVIYNTTAYIATVYCSSVLGNTTPAGVGLFIPANKAVLLRSDGTNIFEQFNHVQGSLSVGGATTFGSTVTLNVDPTLALQAATKQYVDSAVASGVPTGVLTMWSTGTAPSGWLLCNGAAVSRTTYAALFAVIGTTFGAGDTTTTFNLPDYRDRMPIGANTIAASIGATGGSKDAVVVSHNHTASTTATDSGHTHTWQQTIVGNQFAGTDTAGNFARTSVNTSTGFANITASTTVNSTGVSGTNANMPPYLGINFIIKT
jgi:microcystin-dependent protein